jgi:hypothetical protein
MLPIFTPQCKTKIASDSQNVEEGLDGEERIPFSTGDKAGLLSVTCPWVVAQNGLPVIKNAIIRKYAR